MQSAKFQKISYHVKIIKLELEHAKIRSLLIGDSIFLEVIARPAI